MNFRRRSLGMFLVVLLVAGPLTGCRNLNNMQKGALLGSGGGAALGAIIGHQSGNRDKGALIGAGLGGLTGGLFGHAKDKEQERNAAVRHADEVQYQARADARAMTNRDVIDLHQNNIPENQILTAIRNRGGRFDTSPEGLKQLNSYGVSGSIIAVMQGYDQPRF